jgi:hypothetical protein
MYIKGTMRPVETIPGMGGGGIKENGDGEFNYDIRSFVNVTMYHQYNKSKNKVLKIIV